MERDEVQDFINASHYIRFNRRRFKLVIRSDTPNSSSDTIEDRINEFFFNEDGTLRYSDDDDEHKHYTKWKTTIINEDPDPYKWFRDTFFEQPKTENHKEKDSSSSLFKEFNGHRECPNKRIIQSRCDHRWVRHIPVPCK